MGKVSAKFEHQDCVFHSMVVFFIPWPVSLVTVFDNGYMVLAQKNFSACGDIVNCVWALHKHLAMSYCSLVQLVVRNLWHKAQSACIKNSV